MRSSSIVRRGLSVAIVGAALLLASCSSTSTQVSDEIAGQVKSKLDLPTEPTVTCPDDAKAGKGETFTCEIELDGGTVPVKVVFSDDTNFTTTVDGAVYAKAKLDKELAKSLKGNGLELKALSCEGKDFVVFAAKDTITCTATTTTGTDWPIEVGLDAKRNAVVLGSVYQKATLEPALSEQLSSQVDLESLDCGKDELVQAKEDTTIECAATATDGSTATVEVELGADGTASISDVVPN